MSIATKNGSVILKSGSVAQNCGCCGGWTCYPPTLYCNVCPSPPQSLQLSLSFPSLGTFYQRVQGSDFFGNYLQNVRWTPAVSQTTFTLTRNNPQRLLDICTYGFNDGADVSGVGIAQSDPSLPMFSIGVGGFLPSTAASSSASACQQGKRFAFTLNQMTLVLGGYSLGQKQRVLPTSPSYVPPENDTYQSATAQTVGFTFGYAVATSDTYSGMYLIYDAITAGECRVRLELPFSNTITMPFFFGQASGGVGFGQMSMFLQAE